MLGGCLRLLGSQAVAFRALRPFALFLFERSDGKGETPAKLTCYVALLFLLHNNDFWTWRGDTGHCLTVFGIWTLAE
jgi:hypothetical protein